MKTYEVKFTVESEDEWEGNDAVKWLDNVSDVAGYDLWIPANAEITDVTPKPTDYGFENGYYIQGNNLIWKRVDRDEWLWRRDGVWNTSRETDESMSRLTSLHYVN